MSYIELTLNMLSWRWLFVEIRAGGCEPGMVETGVSGIVRKRGWRAGMLSMCQNKNVPVFC